MPRRRKPTGNAIEQAERQLGGEHEAVYRMRVPQRTWARWRAEGAIPFTKYAVRLAKLTGMAVERFSPGWDRD